MTRESKINLKNAFLAISCIVTLIGFFREVDGDVGIGILGILLWGIGPYILFWLATYSLERFSPIGQIPGIGFGISIVITLYALVVYLAPLDHKSSTEGLIFVFAPLWLYLLIFPLLGTCVLVAWLSNRQLADELTDSKLTQNQLDTIDAAVLRNCSGEFRKIARVIGGATLELRDSIPNVPDVLYADRVRQLVSEGKLESQGDITAIRSGEVKLA